MKKLTKEEAVLCFSIEEAISIRNKFNLHITDFNIKTAFKEHKKILLYESGHWSTVRGATEFKIKKASEILNKGVSKKQLSKRLSKIEKYLGLNTEVSVSGDINLEFIPNVSKNLGIQLIKNELTELPEKWCYKASEEFKQKLCEYYEKKYSKDIRGLCWMYINSENHILSSHPKSGFTEINDDQFKKWVLKEDEKREARNQAEKDTNNAIEKAMYELEKPLSIREVQVKVTSQEEANECAEIAKACGEIVSMEIPFKENEYVFRFGLYKDFDLYYEEEKYKTISIQEYRERFGKPDISKLETTEIDWSKAGQYVINEHNAVWRTTGNHNNHLFEGILIRLSDKSDKPNSELFKTKNIIVKEKFKLCTEPITLSND